MIKVPYDVAGPMGRAILRLPCGHRRVAVSMADHAVARKATRWCRQCHKTYLITFPPQGDAIVTVKGESDGAH